VSRSPQVPAQTCQVCGRPTQTGLDEWHLVCRGCGYEASTLQPSIPDLPTAGPVDEELRADALRDLRVRNFKRLLVSLDKFASGGSLLEVGSAHGWFLDLASKKYAVTGIEPDATILDREAGQAWPVIRGYFPADVDPKLRFDVITFNDSLEHIPDLRGIVETCHERLAAGGLVVISLPSSRGAIYRSSKLFRRVGIRGPFERMWQKGLPSPHLHYVGPRNLRKLLDGCGFDTVELGTTPSVSLRGLRQRIAYAGGAGAVARWGVFMAVLLSMPALRVLPSDAMYVIARRRA
jgi:SAM-dependent methyltransferase